MDKIPQYTVSELVNSIKTVLEGSFGYLKIMGEISSFKKATSGHSYFNLKDSDSMINIVFFKNQQMIWNNNTILEDGLEVLVYGRLSIYKDRSNYQIIADKVEINGEGALIKIIEERKKKLETEGLFDKSLKKEIPKIINRVGIITAPNGAAIKDIEVRLKDRLPINEIILFPSLVQGQGADKSIINGIKCFNSREIPDVIVITRGGGSMEDLMCFNSENLAREIFKSKIPIISAVGHEIDWTITDYVADLRLPTPTAVAEFLSPLKSVAEDRLNFIFKKIVKISYKIIENLEYKTVDKVDKLIKNIKLGIGDRFLNKLFILKSAEIRLKSFDKNRILKLGYAIVKKNGKSLSYKTKINIGDELEIELYRKKIIVEVKEI